MAIDNVPLFFGFNHEKPIGRISIFDERVEKQFLRDLKTITEGRIYQVPRYLLAFQGKINPRGIDIISFAFVPDPVTSPGRMIKSFESIEDVARRSFKTIRSEDKD